MEYLSTGDCAKRLDLSADRIRQLCNQGKLDVVRLSNGVRAIPVESLKRFGEGRNRKPRRTRAA